jgi:predicted type IV restriction endonuclease
MQEACQTERKSNQYSNSFLMKSCGEEVTALLVQCLTYCQRCGLRYAVATTGQVWIVLVGFLEGLEWGDLHSYVFHSLEAAPALLKLLGQVALRESVAHDLPSIVAASH